MKSNAPTGHRRIILRSWLSSTVSIHCQCGWSMTGFKPQAEAEALYDQHLAGREIITFPCETCGGESHSAQAHNYYPFTGQEAIPMRYRRDG